MEKENYMWETTFETSENLMIHTFSERVKVVSNIKTGIVKVFKDGEVISSDENPTMVEYEKFMMRVAIDAENLEKFAEK